MWPGLAFAIRIQVKRLIPQLTTKNAYYALSDFPIETKNLQRAEQVAAFDETLECQYRKLREMPCEDSLNELKQTLGRSEYLEDYLVIHTLWNEDKRDSSEFKCNGSKYGDVRTAVTLAEMEQKKANAALFAKKLGLVDFEIVLKSFVLCG